MRFCFNRFLSANHLHRDTKEVFEVYLKKTKHAEQDYKYAISILESYQEEDIESIILAAALQTSKQGGVVTENSIIDAIIQINDGPSLGEDATTLECLLSHFICIQLF